MISGLFGAACGGVVSGKEEILPPPSFPSPQKEEEVRMNEEEAIKLLEAFSFWRFRNVRLLLKDYMKEWRREIRYAECLTHKALWLCVGILTLPCPFIHGLKSEFKMLRYVYLFKKYVKEGIDNGLTLEKAKKVALHRLREAIG